MYQRTNAQTHAPTHQHTHTHQRTNAPRPQKNYHKQLSSSISEISKLFKDCILKAGQEAPDANPGSKPDSKDQDNQLQYLKKIYQSSKNLFESCIQLQRLE